MDVPQICGKDVAGETCKRIPGHVGECIPGSVYKMALNSMYGRIPVRSLLPRQVIYWIIVATALISVQAIFDIIVAIRLSLCHRSKSPAGAWIATGKEQDGTCQHPRSLTGTTRPAVMR